MRIRTKAQINLSNATPQGKAPKNKLGDSIHAGQEPNTAFFTPLQSPHKRGKAEKAIQSTQQPNNAAAQGHTTQNPLAPSTKTTRGTQRRTNQSKTHNPRYNYTHRRKDPYEKPKIETRDKKARGSTGVAQSKLHNPTDRPTQHNSLNQSSNPIHPLTRTANPRT